MTTALQSHATDMIQLGTFSLGTEEFAVDLLKFREIIRMLPITKVPCAEDFVEGAINLRGVIIPIVNLRARFRMPPKPFDKGTRIINMDVDGLTIGFIVDSIGQVSRIPTNSIEPPPAVIACVDSEYISGISNINDKLLIILDVDKIMSPETLLQLAQL